jgi:hypothetical protein
MSSSLFLLLPVETTARACADIGAACPSPRHAALAGISMLLLLVALSMPVWLTFTDAYRDWRIVPELVQEGAAVLLLLFFVVNVLGHGGSAVGALNFEPAEVDFLFPAPYARRELLTYKLLANTSGLFFNALALGLMFYPIRPASGGRLRRWLVGAVVYRFGANRRGAGERHDQRTHL